MGKKVIIGVLWAASLFFGYKIYDAINGPLEFNKLKVKRFMAVIERLEDIKKSQEAYRTIKGGYAKDFPSLIKFIDTARFVITQQRDTSWMQYDKVYRIDVLRQGVIIDTLGFMNVKDSLFKNTTAYKDIETIPGSGGDKFEMKIGTLLKAGQDIPVFEVTANKKSVLKDQPEDLVDTEIHAVGIDEIAGEFISLGSMTEISTNGNWPTLYDAQKKK